jgi:hypothetical protein
VRVFPPSAQRPLTPAVSLPEGASIHDAQHVLRAGFGAVLPHRLAAALPSAWSAGLQAPLIETVASAAELHEPVPTGVTARLLLASLRRPEPLAEVAAAIT